MSSNENADPAQIAHRVRMANGQTADGFVVEKYDGTDVLTIDKDGNITAIGDFAFTGDLALTGGLSATTLSVSGAATLPSITGPTTLTGALTQVGAVGLTGNLTQTGNQVVTGTMSVSGEVQMPMNPDAASYIVWMSGSTYYAKNGATGAVAYSGAQFVTNVLNPLSEALSAAGGGKICIRSGAHAVEAPIYLYDNIHYEGEGSATVLTLDAAVNERMFMNEDFVGGNHGIEISDMTVNGNNTAQTVLGTVDAFNNAGCIHLDNVLRVSVHDMVINDPFATGIELLNVSEGLVYANRIYHATDDGIGVNDGCADVVVTGNYVYGSGRTHTFGGVFTSNNGIEVQDGAQRIVVANNICYYTAFDGIQVSTHTGGTLVHDVSITGNLCYQCATNGISVAGISGQVTTRVLVSGNYISLCASNGISVASYADDIAIVGNYVHDVTYDGIVLGSTTVVVTNISVQGNHINDPDRYGIYLRGTSKVTVAENYVHDGTHGIYVYNATATNIWIRNNFIDACSVANIYDGSAAAHISDNVGWTTENSNTSTGTGAQQTIAHGLAAAPTRVLLSESTTGGALAYQSAAADATNIYITATNAKTYQWEAKVV